MIIRVVIKETKLSKSYKTSVCYRLHCRRYIVYIHDAFTQTMCAS